MTFLPKVIYQVVGEYLFNPNEVCWGAFEAFDPHFVVQELRQVVPVLVKNFLHLPKVIPEESVRLYLSVLLHNDHPVRRYSEAARGRSAASLVWGRSSARVARSGSRAKDDDSLRSVYD